MHFGAGPAAWAWAAPLPGSNAAADHSSAFLASDSDSSLRDRDPSPIWDSTMGGLRPARTGREKAVLLPETLESRDAP